MQTPENSAAATTITLELTVSNHPGVMSHICGLFARRAFNVEGILCMPIGNGEHSRIWLLVQNDGRLEQMEKQAAKLADVIHVRRANAEHDVFVHLEDFFDKDASVRDVMLML